MHLLRTQGVRGLLTRITLDGVATELRLPYVQVAEAALCDSVYLAATDHVDHAEDDAQPYLAAVTAPLRHL